ncbi:MAG: hypothetical protein H6737_22805 [Alphaproteobacteria bacterium]|nr:hypothetical protein [Alphaproteobacteria bacterium]
MIAPVVVLSLWACRAPPEAPEDLDSVAAYLFEKHLDPDPEVVAVGLEQLRTWFETDFDPEANRGFQLIVPLGAEAVGALDASVAFHHPDAKESRASEGMGGAAAGTVGTHALDDYVAALVAVDQDVVFPDTFESWGRTWRLCDGDTFAVRGCDTLESDEQQLSAFGLGMRSEGEAYNQYRWVELSDGSFAMNHRNWQIYPPDVSSSLLEVVDQYYLNTFVPSSDGSEVFRFQATWAVFGDSVPEDIALNLTANAMFDSSQELDAWLDENDP